MGRHRSREDHTISIACTTHFSLFEFPERASGEWRSLKLERIDGQDRKRNWWFGWNGERLAGSNDAKRQRRNHPDVHEWVVETLRQGTECSP